jgi:hypothetical protein
VLPDEVEDVSDTVSDDDEIVESSEVVEDWAEKTFLGQFSSGDEGGLRRATTGW